MSHAKPSSAPAAQRPTDATIHDAAGGRPACPACGGPLEEQRGKLLCRDCHRICESCCEGGLG